MERMTPNYMYEDIGKSTQFLRNKDELLSSQRSFYKREKEDIRDLLREYYSETSNKSKVKTKLQQYIERYHKKNNPMYSDSSLFAEYSVLFKHLYFSVRSFLYSRVLLYVFSAVCCSVAFFWLEYNLALIPNVADNFKSAAAANGSKILSCNISINGYDDITLLSP